jgi:transmembrane sensor
MTDNEQTNDSSQEIPAQVLRGAGLIRDEVAVRWPAGHVELAIIQLQRRRQQRRYRAAGAVLSVAGVGLAVAVGFGGQIRDELAARGLLPRLAGVQAVASRPAARASSSPAAPSSGASSEASSGAVTAPIIVPAPIAVRASAEPAGAAQRPAEGHLLQQRLVPRRQVAAARWVTLAGEKRFGEAYGLLRQVPLRDLSDPDDLMLAADVARQAGRPERAVPFLERVVKEHPTEVPAQLAGFSLGKVYLDNLDEPALAAHSFAAVRAMAPGGGLAQDALAREVEAWSRAGESARARDAALEYVRLYPHGRRLAAVRDLGGI